MHIIFAQGRRSALAPAKPAPGSQRIQPCDGRGGRLWRCQVQAGPVHYLPKTAQWLYFAGTTLHTGPLLLCSAVHWAVVMGERHKVQLCRCLLQKRLGQGQEVASQHCYKKRRITTGHPITELLHPIFPMDNADWSGFVDAHWQLIQYAFAVSKIVVEVHGRSGYFWHLRDSNEDAIDSVDMQVHSHPCAPALHAHKA